MGKKIEISNKTAPIIVIILLAAMFFQAVSSMRLKSLTFDETSHLPAGYSYLMTGDYRINLEQPPLIKLLAGIPLLFFKQNLPLYSAFWQNSSQYEFGSQFLYYSGNDADKIIFWGRIPIVFLGLLLGYFIYAWAGRLYGNAAGLFALFFYVFCPNMLAHTRLVAMDFGLGCFMLIACYQAWSYLEKPSVSGLLLTAIFTGLALVAKFSAVVLIPVLFVMFCFRVFLDKTADKILFPGKKHLQFITRAWFIISRFLAIGVICIVIIFIVYGFRPDALALYKKGLDMIYWNQSQDYKFYLNGRFSLKPWWYYYLFAFLIKTPIPTLLLIAVSIALAIKKKLYNEMWLILPILIINLISFFDSRNMGLRRILPIYPFIFVFIGKVAVMKREDILPVKKAVKNSILGILMFWYLLSAIKNFPDYLTYFNEFAGGPKKGIYYLDDSNIDWGQDLKRLKPYMDSHNIDQIKLMYYGTADANYYKIKTVPVSDNELVFKPEPGYYYAISAHYLPRLKLGVLERGSGLDWLKEFKPVDIIGNTIYIYKF